MRLWHFITDIISIKQCRSKKTGKILRHCSKTVLSCYTNGVIAAPLGYVIQLSTCCSKNEAIFENSLSLSVSVVNELVSRLSHANDYTCNVFWDSVSTCMRHLRRLKINVSVAAGTFRDKWIKKAPLTLIWVGFLGVQFEVGVINIPPLSKAC